MTVSTPGKLVLQAAMIEINGSVVQINAAMVQCSGVVKADTIEATNVVASNYTPGAGNVW
jgi:flagellar basal body L-ring protein FlgH